jgi:hypothetical protein
MFHKWVISGEYLNLFPARRGCGRSKRKGSGSVRENPYTMARAADMQSGYI